MYPVLLQLGSFRLHSYGIVVLAAILVALWLAGLEARRKRLPPEFVSDLGVAVVLAGFVGARLAHVLGWEPELLWRDPAGVFAVWRGGLALHGGLLAGFAAGVWLCRRRRLDPWVVGDAVAPALILGQGIGRLACLLSGDGYGAPTALPWAITFTSPEALAPLGVPLHPTQLYEFGLDLGLFGVLWAVRKRMTVDGRVFLLYAVGYGVIRLLSETVRGDRVELGLGLSLLQAVSLAVLLAGALGWAWRRAVARPHPSRPCVRERSRKGVARPNSRIAPWAAAAVRCRRQRGPAVVANIHAGGRLNPQKEVGSVEANKGLITITDKAASKLREIMAEEAKPARGVRLAVVRTHCMGGRGFANRLAFEDTTGTADKVLEHAGISVYIDQASAGYLRGTELDYVETPTEAGFKIENPNVIAKCPCGHHDIFEERPNGM